MATQTDVQQLIQGLGPSGVNNGNPNTAYNNPPIPMQNAAGQWVNPATTPAASIAALDLPALSAQTPTWQAPAGQGPVDFRSLLPQLTGSMPLGQVPGGGVVTAPGTGGGITPWTPPTQIGGGAVAGPGGATGGGTGTGGSLMDQLSQGGISGVPNVGLPQVGGGSSGGFGDALGQMLGADAGTGSMDWQQALDLATEVLGGFRGNDLYQSNLNQWNSAEIVKGTLDTIFGNGAGALAERIGTSGFLQTLEDKGIASSVIDAIQDFFLKGQIQKSLEGEAADRNQTASGIARDQIGQAGLGASNAIGSWLPSMDFTLPTGTATVGDILSGAGTGPLSQAQLEAGYAQGAATGGVTGGSGGPRSTVQYGSQAERDASIAATQDALRAMAAASPNTRQTGGDLLGRLYER